MRGAHKPTATDGRVLASRWPGWVYEVGEEPDVRFTFANERTFLAWIRTALALLAGGVAAGAIDLALADQLQRVLAAVLTALGLVCAVVSWFRWARLERALRLNHPLPGPILGTLVAAGLTVAGVGLFVAMLADRWILD